MYLRIMNKLDVACMKEAVQEAIKNPIVFKKVFGRISDAITSLDEAYGEGRESLSMGGFVFLLTDSHSSEQIRRQILECYSLSEEESEYREEICRESGQKAWIEELYLRGSDDAVVIIYAQKLKSSKSEREQEKPIKEE